MERNNEKKNIWWNEKIQIGFDKLTAQQRGKGGVNGVCMVSQHSKEGKEGLMAGVISVGRNDIFDF